MQKHNIEHSIENSEERHNKQSHHKKEDVVIKHKKRKKSRKRLAFKVFKNIFLFFVSIFLIITTLIIIFTLTITVPDFSNFANRKIDNSTQIYDKTGQILLYDIYGNVKRTQVDSKEIPKHVKDAVVAIEDRHFYEHFGIRPSSIFRALFENLKAGSFVQGGSTIDQQVIKNALLSQDKNIIRKIKEWAMAIKLDSQVSKDDILTIYLNEAAYGGTVYGIQTASKFFFNKDVKDLTLAETAYITALPNAPSYYSPYGNHLNELENRKNLILRLMFEQNKINKEEYEKAKIEKVVWQKNIQNGKAMHFVFFVRDYLEKKYGKDVVDKGGLKVITTIDYDLQANAEEIIKKYALENAKKYHATNAGLIAMDVKTGQILTMVGSRDYFDTEIQGNFNVTTSLRQPGSAFKPIVYATSFLQGYNPNTILFDVNTEFSTTCSYDSKPLPGYENTKCYSPENYDGIYRGPVTIRNALAQSLNIPAVKTLYLVGVKNAISTAQKMGINSLNINNEYGLSLVLGSGEVSLLELTNAYSVFANNGTYNPISFITTISDRSGNVLEEYRQNSNVVLPDWVAGNINDILSDNNARTPLYGPNSGLHFPNKAVAAKTGTTNSYRDTWTIGYSPSIAVGVWAGNNDNTPINKQLSGMIAVPMWNEFMKYALKNENSTSFEKYQTPNNINIENKKPPVNGLYCYENNNVNYSYSILDENDSQYYLWKTVEDIWIQNNTCPFSNNPTNELNNTIIPTSTILNQ